MKNLRSVHIIGIGGCASSAIAELLIDNQIKVSGSELKKRDDLKYLEEKGVKICYGHKKENLFTNDKPDLVLYSPAIIKLNPDNPEIIESRKQGIPLQSWQAFIGKYLNHLGKIGITVSGSEGKGTTAGILTVILKDTEYDPLSILGAKIKRIFNQQDSNIYVGEGKAYILEGDEFDRNFFNYHPAINIMINFEYEHPETYADFSEYKKAFFEFFSGMEKPAKLVLHAKRSIINFVNEYKIAEKHPVIWFGNQEEINLLADKSNCYLIENQQLNLTGNSFNLRNNNQIYQFQIPALPGYIVYNATGAIITALELGVDQATINSNLQNFKGMLRRFDLYKTNKQGIILTDYGHSPESITHIIKELKTIFPDRKLHLIFQPHLFSRTYNFFNDFVTALKNADRISLIDIYPAREHKADWENKVSSSQLAESLSKVNNNVYYAGESASIYKNMLNKIDENEITCFLGAGDMDLYYSEIFEKLGAESYF